MRRFIMILSVMAALLLSAGCGGETGSDLSGDVLENTSDNLPEKMSQSVSSAADSSNDASGASNTNTADIDFEPFKCLPKSDDTINTINSKEFRPSLLCYGDGNTFFMWDGTVYKHDGKTTEPLFEKYAYDLNYSDGRLYFIEDDSYDLMGRDIVNTEGLLYYYDLETKELKAVTDYPVIRPVVDNGNIYYLHYSTADNPDPPTGIYRVDENGDSEMLYRGISYIRYGDYHLIHDWSDGERVYFSDGDKNLLLENINPYADCIDGEYYYFRSESDRMLNRLSLSTGEIMSLVPNKEYEGYCLDYTVLNDKIYFIGSKSKLMTYNEDTKDFTKINCEYVYDIIEYEETGEGTGEETSEEIILKDEYSFRYIYSDGKNIYGVAAMHEKELLHPTLHFIKLTINGDSAECEILV